MKRALLLLVLAPGCGFMVQQLVGRPKTHLTAANPLRDGDGVLEATALSADAMTRTYAQEQTCDHWPVGDSYRLEITGDQVCATVVRDGSMNQPAASRIKLTADARTIDLGVLSTGDETQVAHCQSGDQPLDVYQHAYRGCTANDGLITATTAQIVVDKDVSWALHD